MNGNDSGISVIGTFSAALRPDSKKYADDFSEQQPRPMNVQLLGCWFGSYKVIDVDMLILLTACVCLRL